MAHLLLKDGLAGAEIMLPPALSPLSPVAGGMFMASFLHAVYSNKFQVILYSAPTALIFKAPQMNGMMEMYQAVRLTSTPASSAMTTSVQFCGLRAAASLFGQREILITPASQYI